MKHCEKRLPLKERSFWERGNFSLKYLNLRETSGLNLFSCTWKHTNLCNKILGVFSSIIFLQPWWPIWAKNVYRFVILCICWDTPSENTGLWQLPSPTRLVPLKGKYTFGNCQRPVFSLGVSHHKHKITSLWKFRLNWSSTLREND